MLCLVNTVEEKQALPWRAGQKGRNVKITTQREKKRRQGSHWQGHWTGWPGGVPRFQAPRQRGCQDAALTSTSASPCTKSWKTRITCSRLRVVLKSVLQDPSAFLIKDVGQEASGAVPARGERIIRAAVSPGTLEAGVSETAAGGCVFRGVGWGWGALGGLTPRCGCALGCRSGGAQPKAKRARPTLMPSMRKPSVVLELMPSRHCM